MGDSSLDAHGPALQMPVVPVEEIDSAWAGKPWADSDYRARVELVDGRLDFDREGLATPLVWIENLGNQIWPSAMATEPLVRLSYHWYKNDGTMALFDGVRTAFPGPVKPGERILLRADIRSAGSGKWDLELDLVHERHRWFGTSLRIPVEVGDYSSS
jgi:hypothetical protein